MDRYAAKLLFQYRRADARGRHQRRRVCEERVIHFQASCSESALEKARAYGADSEYRDTAAGRDVLVEFVGVLELDSFVDGADHDPVEVWWEFRECLLPMERREKLLPRKEQLRLFLDGSAPNKKMKL